MPRGLQHSGRAHPFAPPPANPGRLLAQHTPTSILRGAPAAGYAGPAPRPASGPQLSLAGVKHTRRSNLGTGLPSPSSPGGVSCRTSRRRLALSYTGGGARACAGPRARGRPPFSNSIARGGCHRSSGSACGDSIRLCRRCLRGSAVPGRATRLQRRCSKWAGDCRVGRRKCSCTRGARRGPAARGHWRWRRAGRQAGEACHREKGGEFERKGIGGGGAACACPAPVRGSGPAIRRSCDQGRARGPVFQAQFPVHALRPRRARRRRGGGGGGARPPPKPLAVPENARVGAVGGRPPPAPPPNPTTSASCCA